MNINSVLNIQIALQSLANLLPSFGTTLYLTRDNAPATGGPVWSYSDLTDVGTDWGTSSTVYLKAQAFFQQNPSGNTLLIAHGAAAVAQVDTVAVSTVDDTHLYVFQINGVTVEYQATGGQTAAQIAAALEAAAATVIAAQGWGITAAYQATTNYFTLTGNSVGYPFTTTSTDADLTVTHTTPVQNGAQDLITLKQSGPLGKSWYCLEVTPDYKNNVDLEALADYIETQPNIFVVTDPNSNVDNLTGSFMAYCKTKGYNNTLVIAATQALLADAAVASVNLTFTPGSKNWAWTQVVGVTPDNYTDTEIANIEGQNGNYYTPLQSEASGSSINIFMNGQVGSGQYIDTILGRDWIKFNLQNNLLNLFLTTNIVPYTDEGISMIDNVVRNTLKQAVTLGILAPSATLPQGFEITPVQASQISSEQKATRVFNLLSWTGNLAGAINRLVPVEGTLGFF